MLWGLWNNHREAGELWWIAFWVLWTRYWSGRAVRGSESRTLCDWSQLVPHFLAIYLSRTLGLLPRCALGLMPLCD